MKRVEYVKKAPLTGYLGRCQRELALLPDRLLDLPPGLVRRDARARASSGPWTTFDRGKEECSHDSEFTESVNRHQHHDTDDDEINSLQHNLTLASPNAKTQARGSSCARGGAHKSSERHVDLREIRGRP